MKESNFDYVRGLVLKQVEHGADILDVNDGVPGEGEVVLLPEVCKVVMEATDVPLCIDPANTDALAAALAVFRGIWWQKTSHR